MSERNMRLEQPARAAQGLMQGVNAIVRDAAKENDAGTLGVDGWIRSGHSLIDLGVRAYAGLLQTLIAGPWWASSPPSGEPSPSEPIAVPARPYLRKFTIVEPFVRVGIPRIRIPNQAIRFEPELLPGGATEFQVALRDYNFVGATYTGKIRLSRAGSAPRAPAEKPIKVTVGL